MSMLADQRRKQKISNLNPNGLKFIKDESNIGQRLMKSMGWEKGGGLGKDGQGAYEPIKPKRNLDNRGLGCDQKMADNWIAHQDGFNALLADLNAENPEGQTNMEVEPAKVSSLERASKKSKRRLHYMKFAQGKDLSLKSDKELAMVFGQRSSSSTPAPQSVPDSKAGSDNENDEDIPDPFLSDFKSHTSTLSLQDYFAAKMASRGNSRVNSANDLSAIAKTPSPLTTEPDPSQIERVSFFIGDDLKLEESSNAQLTEGFVSERQAERKLKKRKKRRHKDTNDEECEHKSGGKTKPKLVDESMIFICDTSDQSNGAQSSPIQEEMDQKPKKRKKSKKQDRG